MPLNMCKLRHTVFNDQYIPEVLGAPNLGLFDDPLRYLGFGLGENMVFPNGELKLFFPAEHKF